MISSVRRRCSALSSWFTRLVRSAISLFNAIIRRRATTLSSATKKEPSPLTIARPLVAEAGAVKSINEAKESRLAANAKVALRANAVIKTGSKRRARGNAEILQKLTQVFDMLSHYTILQSTRQSILGWTPLHERAETLTLRRSRHLRRDAYKTTQ